MIPGMAAFALSQSGMLNVKIADDSYTDLVAQILPSGIRGLVACGMLVALMASLGI